MVAWMAPLFQRLWLVPKVVTKFAIVTSIEYMKKAEKIHEVAFEVQPAELRLGAGQWTWQVMIRA